MNLYFLLDFMFAEFELAIHHNALQVWFNITIKECRFHLVMSDSINKEIP